MFFIFKLIVTAAVIAYFAGFALVLIFAMTDKSKDSTADNKIVAFMLFIGLILVPLFGVLTSLPEQ